MRAFELLHAVLVAVVCFFVIKISVRQHWSPVVRATLTFVVPCLVFVGFSFYYVVAGENITDTIAKRIWCPIYSFAACPKHLSEASEEQARWGRVAALEEAERKRGAEEAARKKAAEEETERKQIAAEAAQKKAAEEETERKRVAEEAALKKATEEEIERKRVAAEAARKMAAEEEAERKRVAEEAARKMAAEEAERKRIAEEFARRKTAEEEAERKRVAEEAARRKVADEEAERKRVAEVAARRKAAEEEAERKRVAAETARKMAAEEAERKRIAEELARRKAAEEEAERKRVAEEAARRKAAEEETERKRVAEEAARMSELNEILVSCSGCGDLAAKNRNEAYLMIVPVEPILSQVQNPYRNTSSAISLVDEDEVRKGVAKGYLKIFRGNYQFNSQRVSEKMYDEYDAAEGITIYPQKRTKGSAKNFKIGFKVDDDEEVTWFEEEYYAIKAGACVVLYAIFYPESGN